MIGEFEERNNDDKVESLEFGTEGSGTQAEEGKRCMDESDEQIGGVKDAENDSSEGGGSMCRELSPV